MQAEAKRGKLPQWVWPVLFVVALGIILLGSNVDPVGPGGGHIIRSPDEFQDTLTKAFGVFEPLMTKFDSHQELTPEDQEALRKNADQFEQLAAFNNAEVAPQFALGKIYTALKEYPMAEERFRQAIDNQPLPTALHFKEKGEMVADSRWCLAQLLQQDNDSKGALEQMNAALKVEPNRPEYYVARAQALIQLNRLPEARTDLKKALNLNPNVERANFLLKFIEDGSKTAKPKAAAP